MDISSLTSAASSLALTQVQQQASNLMLRRALDIEARTAAQLLQALPQPSPQSPPSGPLGTKIDTWA